MGSVRLMTAEQIADDFGLPSARTVRTMRARGLPAVRLGKAFLYDHNDVVAFIEGAKEIQCPDPIAVRSSNSSRNVGATMSSGMSRDARESAQLARLTLAKLKSGSLASSPSATTSGAVEAGRVIHRKFPSQRS